MAKAIKKFSIIFTPEDFELLQEIKTNLHLSTAQQVIRFLVYNEYSLYELAYKSRQQREDLLNGIECETITLSVNHMSK